MRGESIRGKTRLARCTFLENEEKQASTITISANDFSYYIYISRRHGFDSF